MSARKAKRPDCWTTDDPRRIWLEKYSPTVVASDAWENVRDFVVEHASRCDAPLDRSRLIVKVLAQLAAWCVDENISLDIEEVLDPDTCNQWVEHPQRNWSPRTRASYRSALRDIGPKLTRTAPWEPRPQPYSRHPLLPPYEEFEVARIRRDASAQRTALRSREARATVAQGFGAGLDGRWNGKTRGTDVGDDHIGVFICVPPPAERIVYVRRAFAGELLELAELAGDGLLVGSKSTDRNLLNTIARQTAIDQGRIVLNAGRLRATWLVAQLNAGTHLRVLMDPAGLETLDAIRDLIPYVDTIDRDLEAELLVWA